MNQNKIKKILIIVGGIITGLFFLKSLIDIRNISETILDFVFIDGIEGFIKLLGIAMLFFGCLLKGDNKNKKKKKKKKIDIRWNYLLFVLGLMPFIVTLIISIFAIFNGASFMFSTSYGFDGFVLSLMTISILNWPLYLIGIILMVKNIRVIKAKK